MTDNIKEKIKEKIIDLIASGASGRVVVFKPENSDKDLIIEKRGDYKKKVIALNIYGIEFLDDESLKREINKLQYRNNSNSEENFYLLFVHFNILKQDVDDNFWVIPSSSLQKFAELKGHPDDFSKFSINKQNFVRFLLEEFA